MSDITTLLEETKHNLVKGRLNHAIAGLIAIVETITVSKVATEESEKQILVEEPTVEPEAEAEAEAIADEELPPEPEPEPITDADPGMESEPVDDGNDDAEADAEPEPEPEPESVEAVVAPKTVKKTTSAKKA